MSAQRPHPKPANSSNRDGDAAPRPAPHNPAGGQGTAPAPAPGNRSHVHSPHPHSPQSRNGTPNTSGAGEEAESIAAELHLAPANVNAVIALLDSGASVPFIARYRKEATGGMSDTNLRALHTRLTQLRALNQRREAIRAALTERYTEGAIDPLTYEQLLAGLRAARTKTELENLYAPYRSQRITKAQQARAAGLDALVEDLLEVPLAGVYDIAAAYVNETGEDEEYAITTVEEALEGARAILIDRAATDPALTGRLYDKLVATGTISTRLIAGKDSEGAKFADYFDFSERIRSIRSHRVLALLRARQAGIVKLSIDAATPPPPLSHLKGEQREAARAAAENYKNARSVYEREIAAALRIPVQVLNTVDSEDRVLGWLAATVRAAWRKRLHPRLAERIRENLFETAEREAIDVFTSNLRDILLAAPAGQRTTLGLDPGLKHGVKCAVINGTGKVLDAFTIYPHAPRHDWDAALTRLENAVRTHGVELIAIGNGTASRETDKLAAELLVRLRAGGYEKAQKITVSEAGASVYSASATASEELPELDVTLRGAVSIARRLQDPLAELVKIDPQSIGVGQYQHDVSVTALRRGLDATVEDCVNAVGVNLNSASVPLLARVAGLNRTVAENIVAYRNENGPFISRTELLNVPRLGPKAYEQAAGFVRITGGVEPLDASAVHPESYPIARRIIADARARNGAVWAAGALTVPGTSENEKALMGLRPADYITDTAGDYTVRDIFAELLRPGRDPRPEFRTAQFSEAISCIEDLAPGMVLEGVVSNVAAFGAFVDIGVHQDGLVHISQMSRRRVHNTHDVVRSGDIVQVRVVEVDAPRKRISLSLLVDDTPDTEPGRQKQKKNKRSR